MRTLLTILLVMALKIAAAQVPLTYRSADSLTYHQFVNRNYAELRNTVLQALRQDIDFYYLRMRMGISYYESKNYDSAIPHFRRAVQMNPANETANEYYYFSLLFSGRFDDAEDFASSFDADFKKRLGIKETKKPFSEISVGGGAIINQNLQENKSLITGSTHPVALSTFEGNTYFGKAILKSKISPRFSVYNGITFFRSNATGVLKHPVQPGTFSRDYSNSFFQYNIQSIYSFPFGLRLGASAGYYNEKSFLLSYDPEANNPPNLVLDLPYNHNAFSATILAGFRINRFDFFASGSIANLLKKKQRQAEFGIIIYPFGNQSLFSVSRVAYLDNSGNQSIILAQKIGAKLSNNVWAEVEVEAGNMHGYLKSGGLVAFNTADPVGFNSGLNLNFLFGNLSIISTFGLQQRNGEIFEATDPDQQGILSEVKYWNQLFSLSVRYRL